MFGVANQLVTDMATINAGLVTQGHGAELVAKGLDSSLFHGSFSFSISAHLPGTPGGLGLCVIG